MTIAYAAESAIHISLKAEPVFHIGAWPITNSLLLSTIILCLLSGLAIAGKRKLALIPGNIQNVFEMFLEALLDLMDSVFGERAKSEKYLPLIATIFLFVLFSNWFGLLPGVGAIKMMTEEGSVPLLRAPSADLNFTIALALIAVISVNILGAVAIGIGPRLKNFFNFSDPIAFFIGLIELVSEAARIVSFSFRLFGNIFAGEVLLTIVGFLAPYFIPLPFLFLEVFVGFVQALIFSMLSVVFIAIATVDHHAAEHASAH
ncbi:MAG TPA: F0F1 ATP synthase subunit A [Candidatus Paceibacterota bacterium]|nr:F0F1 ATP synthase subunit A [Candidatus Paceibacterota bacterium]